jgi:hypothetical protein
MINCRPTIQSGRSPPKSKPLVIDVFNLEDKSGSDGMQSWLPSGWTYDAKLNEFQLGETQDF